MNNYRKKISELQKQIEEKAKELGHIKSIVEELTKQRQVLGVSITKAEEDVKALKNEKLELQSKIEEAERKILAVVSPVKGKIKNMESAVAYLESVASKKEQLLAEAEEIKRGIVELENKKEEVNEKYIDAQEVIFEIRKEIQGVIREKEILYKENETEHKKLVGEWESFRKQKENQEAWQKELKFRARRLFKFYTEKGLGFPKELMDDFKPLNYFPTRELSERLRLKKAVKSLKTL